MLKINKGEPWIFWPNSICETFPENAGNKILSNKLNYTMEIDFTLTDESDLDKTLFALVPRYTGFNINNDGISFTITFQDDVEYYSLPHIITPHELTKLKLNHIYKDKIELQLNDEIILSVDLSKREMGLDDSPHIIFGAGNFPKNITNTNYTEFEFHKFKLTSNEEIVSDHTFNEFIHNKSVDISGNCNFLHKI
jgi:hypothetical protein|tara:strand:+ start:1489 stop:2073 length:585 start_codon:yes stop_codon:yes gene_type:complete